MLGRVLVAATLACAVADAADAQPAPAVVVGVAVTPDTVQIGTPFLLSVRVRAPLGDSIVFPDGPDSTAIVQAIDPPEVRGGADTAAVDRTAYYRVAAWDVGAQEVQLGDVRVIGRGGARVVPLPPARVFVATVLPEDTTLRVPKPERPVIEWPRPWWIPWLIGLLVAALLGLLLWWWWRRRPRRQASVTPLSAYADAEERFAGIERLGLVAAGERGRHVALMLEVLRDYLARAVPAAHPALTSRELLAALGDAREVPRDRLVRLLYDGDMVKFARRAITDEQALALGHESRGIARAVHEALQPAPPPSTGRRTRTRGASAAGAGAG